MKNSEALVLGTDYTISAEFNNSYVYADKSVTGTVALIENGSVAKNYTLANGSLTLTGQTIHKAIISGVNQTFEVVKGQAHTYSYDIMALLPDVAPGVFNNLAYSITSVTNTDGVLATVPSIGTTVRHIFLDIADVADIDKTATITVTISSLNYNDFTAVLTVKTADKQPVTISADMAGGTYNGNPYAYSNAVVTKNIDMTTVNGITLDVLYESTDGGGYSSATAPTNIGKYKLMLSVPGDNFNYTGSAVFNFSITKLPVAIVTDNKSTGIGGGSPNAQLNTSGATTTGNNDV